MLCEAAPGCTFPRKNPFAQVRFRFRMRNVFARPANQGSEGLDRKQLSRDRRISAFATASTRHKTKTASKISIMAGYAVELLSKPNQRSGGGCENETSTSPHWIGVRAPFGFEPTTTFDESLLAPSGPRNFVTSQRCHKKRPSAEMVRLPARIEGFAQVRKYGEIRL